MNEKNTSITVIAHGRILSETEFATGIASIPSAGLEAVKHLLDQFCTREVGFASQEENPVACQRHTHRAGILAEFRVALEAFHDEHSEL